jgi:hypothetical protein
VFYDCSGLTNITIPNSITNIGSFAFSGLNNLAAANFDGNAPSVDSTAFYGDNNAFVIYLPGTTGWSPTIAGLVTELWNAQVPSGNTGSGIRTNQFGFNITGNTNLAVVVESSTSLVNSVWSPLATNILAGGSYYFSYPQWTNSRTRFYRLRSP